MINPRQLINQLRVGYFCPSSSHVIEVIGQDHTFTASCHTDLTPRPYGRLGFCTPVVPYVGSIPSITTSYERCQSPCVQHLPVGLNLADTNDYCVPTRIVINPSVAQYRLARLDYSTLFRQGYVNTFHQLLQPFQDFPLLIKGQPLNIFF